MKPFDRSIIYTRLAPLLNLLIPDIPLRPFFFRLIIAFLTSQTIGALVTLGQSILGSPLDNTWQYYLFLALETIQYGCWFWVSGTESGCYLHGLFYSMPKVS